MDIVIGGWLILAIVVASAASARGRDAKNWFLLSLVISPIIALLALLAYPAQQPKPGLWGKAKTDPRWANLRAGVPSAAPAPPRRTKPLPPIFPRPRDAIIFLGCLGVLIIGIVVSLVSSFGGH
jgi:hypothetical protein